MSLRVTRWPHPSSRTVSSSAPMTTSSPILRFPTRPGRPVSHRQRTHSNALRGGEPPARQGDYAYLLHIVRSMKGTGKAACVLPHGVLFRGHAEATIREQLVRSGYLKGIIGLPPNLFYGTGIPACIVVLDKENAAGRRGVFMIDASKGFREGLVPRTDCVSRTSTGSSIRLRRQVDVPRYARMVGIEEIGQPEERLQSQPATLHRQLRARGPAGHRRPPARRHPGARRGRTRAYWQVFPSVCGLLFESAGRPGYARLKPAITGVRHAILEHSEFSEFQQKGRAGSLTIGEAPPLRASPPLTGTVIPRS